MLKIVGGDRPEKPKAARSLGFTDELWSMVERCWQESWDERPEAKEIVDYLESAAKAWDTRPSPPADTDSTGSFSLSLLIDADSSDGEDHWSPAPSFTSS